MPIDVGNEVSVLAVLIQTGFILNSELKKLCRKILIDDLAVEMEPDN